MSNEYVLHRPKLPHKVAAQIEREIASLHWPVGLLLGNEAALAKKWRVSRPIMREAMAIIERDGLGRIDRGRRGGLVVAAPASSTIVMTLRNYLLMSGINISQLLDCLEPVRIHLIDLAVRNLDDFDVKALRVERERLDGAITRTEAIKCWIRVGRIMARTTKLEIIDMVQSALSRAILDFQLLSNPLSLEERWDTTATTHKRNLIEAVIAGDLSRAFHEERELLGKFRHIYRGAELRLGPPGDLEEEIIAEIFPDTTPPSWKLADRLALEITRRISTEKIAFGESLGSETSLMKLHGVGRAVLRQAVRSLERYQVVYMERGRGGGLIVGKASPGAAVHSASIYLTLGKADTSALHEMAGAVENAAISAVCALSAAGRKVDAFEWIGPPSADNTKFAIQLGSFYSRLAAASENPAMELILSLFTSLVAVIPDDSIDPLRLAVTEVRDAIQLGDVALARHRMIQLRRLARLVAHRSRDAAEIVEISEDQI